MHARKPSQVQCAFVSIFIVFMLLIVEVGAYVSLKILQVFPTAKALFYSPPELSIEEYREYLKIRDSRLGWPNPDQVGGDRFDITGSRPIPTFPTPGNECLSLYGDSFTYGDEVSNADAWSNVLSILLKCRVANYGVPAYGTDQAYLRFEGNETDVAPVTILGVYALELLRNISQYLYFQLGSNSSGDTPKTFKPRFILRDRRLELVPLPYIPTNQLEAFLAAPHQFLPHETFLPGTQFGPSRVTFPYVLTLLRLVWNERVITKLRGQPSWFAFAKPGHPSQALEVTVGIVEKFASLCRQRGKRCLVVLFPTGSSYNYYRKTETLALQSLGEVLQRFGIDALDVTPGLAQYLGEQSYCTLLTACSNGHYNPEGNRVVARLIHARLVQNRF